VFICAGLQIMILVTSFIYAMLYQAPGFYFFLTEDTLHRCDSTLSTQQPV